MELYTITVPATEQPITLAEAKTFMKVSSTFEDDLISGFIIAATEQIEQYTGQVFIIRTFLGEFSVEYISKTEVYPYVKLRRAPVQTVNSVQISVDDTFIDESYQKKKPTHGFTRILFNEAFNYLDDIPYPLQINFDAGYGTASEVPENVKLAIKMYVNFIYRNRGDCLDSSSCGVLKNNSGLPPVVKALLAPYKIIEVYA